VQSGQTSIFTYHPTAEKAFLEKKEKKAKLLAALILALRIDKLQLTSKKSPAP